MGFSSQRSLLIIVFFPLLLPFFWQFAFNLATKNQLKSHLNQVNLFHLILSIIVDFNLEYLLNFSTKKSFENHYFWVSYFFCFVLVFSIVDCHSQSSDLTRWSSVWLYLSITRVVDGEEAILAWEQGVQELLGIMSQSQSLACWWLCSQL